MREERQGRGRVKHLERPLLKTRGGCGRQAGRQLYISWIAEAPPSLPRLSLPARLLALQSDERLLVARVAPCSLPFTLPDPFPPPSPPPTLSCAGVHLAADIGTRAAPEERDPRPQCQTEGDAPAGAGSATPLRPRASRRLPVTQQQGSSCWNLFISRRRGEGRSEFSRSR